MKTSSFKVFPCRTCLTAHLAERMRLSRTPPQWGATGGLRNHLTLHRQSWDVISDWLKFCRHSVSSCLALKKFLPLSLWYEISVPYLDSKCIRKDRNASVVIENANRMSTARGDRHVSMHPYRFTLLRNTFTSIGPKVFTNSGKGRKGRIKPKAREVGHL